MTTPQLSAIVLCYQAGDSIVHVIDPLHELLVRADLEFELVLVANYWPNQRDPTPQIVAEFEQTHDCVSIVSQPKQGGMGWDMRCGFAAACGDTMILIDGDSQNPVDDVLKLYRLMHETGAAVGKGRRTTREDGIYRRLVSLVYNALFKILFGSRQLWDINGKPKGLTRDAYAAITLTADDWFVDAELILEAHRAGLSVVELPVVFNRNDDRASFVRAGAIWEFMRHMIRYRLRGSP